MISDWLGYILLGLVTGLSGILPVSANANEGLLRTLFGLEDDGALVGLLTALACMGAVFLQCRPRLLHIYRQMELARRLSRRKKRMTDPRAVRSGRILSGAMLPMAAVSVLGLLYAPRLQQMLPLAGLLVLTGILVYIPQHFPGGNRDSRGMGKLDSLLLGLAAGMGSIPGLSSMGSMLCVGLLRGCDREFILEMALMLTLPVLAVTGAGALVGLVLTGFAGVSLVLVLMGLLAAAAAFGGCYLAIAVMRYLAERGGFSVFAYYSWGLAMFTFILYLMT